MTVTQLRDALNQLVEYGRGDLDVVAYDRGDPEAGIAPGTWDVERLAAPPPPGGPLHPGAAVLLLTT